MEETCHFAHKSAHTQDRTLRVMNSQDGLMLVRLQLQSYYEMHEIHSSLAMKKH